MKTTTKYKYDAIFENALKNDRTSYSLKQALLNGFISCYTNNPNKYCSDSMIEATKEQLIKLNKNLSKLSVADNFLLTQLINNKIK